MTRGLPAAWSALFGAPFLALGAYVYAFQSQYPLVTNQPTAPPLAGVPLALFGLFVVALGVYVQFASTPDEPTMRENEFVVDDRDPAQRSALLQTFLSVPLLAAGLDLLYFTDYPLVYPTLALAAGLYLFSTGIHRYWRNTLTTYVVTNRRVLQEYRFVSLSRTEIPLEKVRAVEERQSVVDTLFGLGNVHVRAGASGTLSVTVRSVYDSAAFADEIRDEIDHAVNGADRGDRADRFDGAFVEATPVEPNSDDAVLAADGTVESLSATDAGAALSDAEPWSDGGTVESDSALGDGTTVGPGGGAVRDDSP